MGMFDDPLGALKSAGSGIDRNATKWYNRSGVQQALPQYNASRPYNVGIGGMQVDMRDPRMLAALALTGNPGLAASVGAYGVGRQAEAQRNDKRLEREYVPRAEASANRSRQAATYGGLQGGVGDVMAQHGFEDIIRLLLQEKQGFRQQQNAQEQQSLGAIGALIPYLAGM